MSAMWNMISYEGYLAVKTYTVGVKEIKKMFV